jgi:hypothetical protein
MTGRPDHLLQAFCAAALQRARTEANRRGAPGQYCNDHSTRGCNQSFISNELTRRSDCADPKPLSSDASHDLVQTRRPSCPYLREPGAGIGWGSASAIKLAARTNGCGAIYLSGL